MGESKRLLMDANKEERPIPSHLVKEMFEEMVKLRKQMNSIKQILEIKDEKNNSHDSNDDNNRVG